MSFRRGGAGKRRDAIEPAVIQALRAIGAEVWQVNGFGLPDVLTLRRGVWLPLGIKSGSKAKLTPSEQRSPRRWPLVTSVEDALARVGGSR